MHIKSSAPGNVTAQELNTLGYMLGKPCELSRGRVVVRDRAETSHREIIIKLSALLRTHVEQRQLGLVLGGDPGFVLMRGPDTVRTPDVAFVRASRVARGLSDQFFEGAPDLAVEVVSLTERAQDVEQRVREYLAAGCAMVWLLDPRTRRVLVRAPGRDVARLGAREYVDGMHVVPGFRCKVGVLFTG